MRQLKILAVGKLKDAGLRAVCQEYYRRCGRRFVVREQELRGLKQLQAALPARGTVIMLDERGEQLASRPFARRLGRWVEDPAGPPTFVIGGADGLGPGLRERSDFLLALGAMTIAHRLVRVLLAEQLYRGVSILDGGPYHRD